MKERTRKQRSFTSELLIWISLLVVLPIVLLMIYFYNNTFSGLKLVEEEKSVLANRAAQLSIVSLGDTISGVTITNGYWEANRQAVLTGDTDWLNKNIRDMLGIVPNVDFVAETNLQGKVLVQAGDVEEFTDMLKYPELLERFKQEESFSGVLNTSKGVALVAVSQVTGDQGVEDAVGILITGRFLNEEIMQALEHTLQTELALLTKTGQFIASSEAVSEDDLKPLLPKLSAGTEQEIFSLERTKSHYLAKVDAPLTDMSGRIIGVIRTQVPSLSTAQAIDGLGKMGLYSLGIMALLLVLVAYLLRQRIILPLRHFTASLEEVAAGRRVDAIPKHVLQAEAEIVSAIQKIMQWNQVLERNVLQRTSSIRSLLDNASQGFLSVGHDLKVKDEYSVECTRIFARNIAGVELPELLYRDNKEEREVLRSILHDYFAERNGLKRELMLSLMPQEVQIGSRILELEVKAIGASDDINPLSPNEDSIMVMLTDISDKRLLENRMQVEQGMLRMVVQAVTHADDCADIARDFERFAQTELAETLAGDETPEEKALSLYKTVHTFKGSFGLLQFNGIVTRLHELESGLQELLGRSDEFTSDELSVFLQAKRLDLWLRDEEELLKQVLGETFDLMGLNQTVKIEREQLYELEHWIEARTVTEEDSQLLERLRAWRYRPIQALLKHYPAYLKEMTDRRGMALHPVLIDGGEVAVDSERYYPFAKSLVHVVRNIVVHGLEPEAQRAAQGKDLRGTVRFDVEHTDGMLQLSIEDDGRGIDLDQLRDKAAKLGLDKAAVSPGDEEDAGMSDQDLLQLIFREQFSTARIVSQWAGRGIGLSAVKEEVDRLGGEIIVTSVPGEGTKFVFLLPDEGAKGENVSG
ncbi:MAG: hypothetical protein K0R67_3576 [Paenibacillus sp.]|nr:hypothetical protein [Paenibacillus sp.]